MIRVKIQAEPADFQTKVGKPGRDFLKICPNPTTEQYKGHDYWTHISKYLTRVYGHICAYTCHWISDDTGWNSVEHFEPKSIRPDLAYVWSNYRLVCGRLNGRRGIRQILDPFKLPDGPNGLFAVIFPSLEIVPRHGLDKAIRDEVQDTIDVLNLNDEETCAAARFEYVRGYCLKHFKMAYLRKYAPFLASEIARQNFVDPDELMVKMGGRFPPED